MALKYDFGVDGTSVTSPRGLDHFWIRDFAYNMLQKLGYRPVLGAIFVSILGLKFCHVRDLTTGKTSLQVRLRQPRGKVTII